MTIIMVRMKHGEFALIYDADVRAHLSTIDAKHHALIRETIEQRLRFEPLAEARNRKPLKRPDNFGAEWELRFGPNNRFRVFYQVDEDRREVQILAIGEKVKNHLFIAGEEIEI